MMLCAGAGALLSAVLFMFSGGYRWIGRSSESGGLAHNLVWFALLLFETLFQTPCGLMGALVGAGLGWLTRSMRRSPEHPQRRP